MPGIAGIFGHGDAHKHAASLRKMIDAMLHEPSYSTGTYVNASLGVYVGWVEHTGSFADCMPLWNETRDVCLIFSGEDFTDKDKIDQLRSRGHDCDASNGRYLMRLYEQMGLRFLESLNGWFSGVLIDLRQRSVTLFNDRFGLHRINYHEHASGFYFGSEAKSLLRVLPALRKVDTAALGEVFSTGCVLDGRTLFPGVLLLPGAAKWMFTAGQGINKSVYFDRGTWERQPPLRCAEYRQRLEETFTRILPRYLRQGNGLGMSLTGGLDCRMIMAWANLPPGTLPCYTFGGEYRDCADVKVARRIAVLCGQEHRTLPIGRDFCAEFPALAEKSVYISDGTMDVSGSVEIYANRLARGIAPIRLTGNYGSEIVRGNVVLRPGRSSHNLLSHEFLPFVHSATATYAQSRQGHDVSFIAFKQVPWYHYARFSVERSKLTPRSPYLDNELVSLMYQAPPALLRSSEPSLQVIAHGNARVASVPTDRGLVLEPFPIIGKFRSSFQEFTAKVEYAYDYGMPQWVATIDHALAPLRLERLFLGRHKFYHFRVWYRDQLSQYLKDVLLDPRSLARPYVNGRYLETLVDQHTRGERNYTSEIHQALTAELVHRLLIEQP